MSLTRVPVVFHPIYSQLTLSHNHRFPIEKYRALKDAAVKRHGNRLQIHHVDKRIDAKTLNDVHHQEYINQFIDGRIDTKAMKRIGFPWSQQFVKRTLTAVAGTIQASKLATEFGIGINFTGGYHHAHPDFGSGFCVFNDLVLAAKQRLKNGEASRVLIFDCDVHQGDGTARCASDDNDIFTLSIHCEKNFPVRKQQSDWDIGLDKYIDDDTYIAHVANSLDAAVNSIRPDFLIYDAGVDIHEDDDLGLFNISTQGIFKRDLLVLETAYRLEIPVMAVIGGGYQRDIAALTTQHMQLIDAAVEVFTKND